MGKRVFLHTRARRAGAEWSNSGRKFERLPVVGELVSVRPGGPLFRVTTVIHCPYGEDYGAEVFAEEAGAMHEAVEANR